MNTRNAICLTLLTGIMAGIYWALRALSKSMEFSSFMLFCGVTVVVMVSCGYLYDYFERKSSPPGQ